MHVYVECVSRLRNAQEVANVYLDVDISAEQVIEASDPDLRTTTTNLRLSPQLLEDLTVFAKFLSDKRRLRSPGAKEIPRSETMVRLLRLAMASVYANEKLPERPTKAEIAARLKELKTS